MESVAEVCFLRTGRVVHRVPCDEFDIRNAAQLVRTGVITCALDYDSYDVRTKAKRESSYRIEDEAQILCEYVRRVNKILADHGEKIREVSPLSDLNSLIDMGKKVVVIAQQIDRENDDGR